MKSAEPVVTIDLAPTFLEMAEVKVDRDDLFDGESFLAKAGRETTEPRTFLLEYKGEGLHEKIDRGSNE